MRASAPAPIRNQRRAHRLRSNPARTGYQCPPSRRPCPAAGPRSISAGSSSIAAGVPCGNGRAPARRRRPRTRCVSRLGGGDVDGRPIEDLGRGRAPGFVATVLAVGESRRPPRGGYSRASRQRLAGCGLACPDEHACRDAVVAFHGHARAEERQQRLVEERIQAHSAIPNGSSGSITPPGSRRGGGPCRARSRTAHGQAAGPRCRVCWISGGRSCSRTRSTIARRPPGRRTRTASTRTLRGERLTTPLLMTTSTVSSPSGAPRSSPPRSGRWRSRPRPPPRSRARPCPRGSPPDHRAGRPDRSSGKQQIDPPRTRGRQRPRQVAGRHGERGSTLSAIRTVSSGRPASSSGG